MPTATKSGGEVTASSLVGGPWTRTFLITDTTPGENVADNVSTYSAKINQTGIIRRIVGVLRVEITEDLTVAFRVIYPDATEHTIGSFTIPASTAVDTAVVFTSFSNSTLPDKSVLIPDIVGSDGSSDKKGIASFTIEWASRGAGEGVATGLAWAGTWSGGATYALGDLVEHDGSTYISLVDDNTGTEPPGGSWDLVAQAGVDGATGATGSTGGTGATGAAGANSYTYIAYASNGSGSGFTTTFNAALDYIAIKTTTTVISSPSVGDFTGLWKNYKGATGAQGASSYTYIAYASDSSGTGFTTTFNSSLDYIAIKTTTSVISSPSVGDFTGLWKNYKGATGAAGPTISWEGTWSSGTTYAVNDGVIYAGNSYIAILGSNTNHQPDTSPTYWSLVGTAGADGEGVATGGSTDQILAKNSGTDFDTVWIDRDRKIFTGSGTPGSVTGSVNNDVYINTTNGTFYKKISGTWTLQYTDVQVPSGGTTGQILAKNSNTNYDSEWIDPPTSLPPGGTTGQVLAKQSTTDGDADWVDGSTAGIASTPVHGFGADFDGGGLALTTGMVAYTRCPVGGVMSSWNIIVDAGTCTIKVWKIAVGTAHPTSANSINTAGVSISTGTAIHSTTLTDFTTTGFSNDDMIGIYLHAVSGATKVSFAVEFESVELGSVPPGGTTGQVLAKNSDGDYDLEWIDLGASAVWGNITGALADQTDLQSALDAKLDDSQLDVDADLSADSDTLIASQKAVKSYVDAHGASWGAIGGTLSSQTDLQAVLDAKLDDSQLDVDATMAANSDTKIASQKATKTALDLKLDDSQLDVDGTLAANSDSLIATQKAVKTFVAANIPTGSPSREHGFGATFDGNGTALTSGKVAYVRLHRGGTIAEWSILVDAGTATIKVWKVASGTALPTSGNSINTSGVAISTGTAVKSTTLTDFTTLDVADDDIVGVYLHAVSGATKVVFSVELLAAAAIGQFGTAVDGGGSVIATGLKGDVQIPYACTIVSWTILCDVSGSIVFDIWKDTYTNAAPTIADTITASAKPTVSSATKATSSTLTGWTTSVAAGDVIRFNVDSASTVTRATLALKVVKT